MAKEIGKIKLEILAGKANPAPPVGPALGQKGLNISEFCKEFNDATKDMQGPVPVIITAFDDRSYSFITKVSPASYLIKQAAKLKKGGSKEPGKIIVAKLSQKQIKEIAETKMKDLNANDIEAAMKIIAGTARSMGIEVEEAA
jgi:large subunit ribosomal protein L11